MVGQRRDPPLKAVPEAPSAPIDHVQARAYRIPTEAPESDGTFEWSATTLVVATIRAGATTGLGYTYAAASAAALVNDTFAPLLSGRDALATAARRSELERSLRNLGREGIGATALSAVDVALWDLRGRWYGAPLSALVGGSGQPVPAYGSGGFTSYDESRLVAQLAGWVEQGITRVKMKVGRDPDADPARVRAVRRAIGDAPELFVDANGAYGRKQALALGREFAASNVTWYEEPVSSDDLEGLCLTRDRLPAPMDVAAGEYGWDLRYFRRMLAAGAVDVLQADATRCGGISGFVAAAALCEAAGLPLSAHCAPALHAALGRFSPALAHLERFHDHARIEAMLFDGAPAIRDGALAPGSAPGLGLTFKEGDAQCYEISPRTAA